MLGFRYREVLHGGFYLLSNPVDERAADVLLDVEMEDVSAFGRSRTPTARLRGHVTLQGFADDADADGKLVLDPEHKRAIYELSFKEKGGDRYRLRGHKELEVLNLVDSFTLVRASLYDPDAREIGRATLRFDARGNWRSLVKSFRFMW
jgi:hypothetical protein